MRATNSFLLLTASMAFLLVTTVPPVAFAQAQTSTNLPWMNKSLSAERRADLLIHDGEFTPAEYESQVEWGHSTYVAALELAMEAGVKQLGLFHHNQDRFDPEMDMIVEDCDRLIAEKDETLKCFAVSSDMAFML